MQGMETCKSRMVGHGGAFQQKHKVNIPAAVLLYIAGRKISVHISIQYNLKDGAR